MNPFKCSIGKGGGGIIYSLKSSKLPLINSIKVNGYLTGEATLLFLPPFTVGGLLLKEMCSLGANSFL